MSNSSGHREQLKFSNLDEVVRRVELLHRDGYTSLGKWNLAQVCEHLNDWMTYMIDGYPKAPLPVRLILGSLRVTMGRSMLHKILTSGKMAAGGPTMSETVHAADGLTDATSLARFKTTLERFKAYQGDYHNSPLFGKFTPQQGLDLQLIHCAHHLSFLVPQPTTADSAR